MSNNDLPIEHILSQIDNQAFYPQHGLQVKKAGAKRWDCVCPFCGDPKHFSLTVTGSKAGLWICSKCNESGNQISFLAKMKGYGNGDAVREIKEGLGLVDSMETRPAGPRRATKKKDAKPKMQTVPPGGVNVPPPPGDGDAPPGGTDAPSSLVTPPSAPPKQSTSQRIYQRLTDLLHLTPDHRAEMKKKRGFTDVLIDEMKFRSGGNHVRAVMEQLRQEFSAEELMVSGVLVKAGNAAKVNDQLTDGQVLIPYLDDAGMVYHLRRHKLGFEKVQAQIYGACFLRERPEHVIVTEGEFKAVALWQWGIPAIGLPGTPSFVRKNLDRLLDFLKQHGVKLVTIIFDNEVKNVPGLPKYKERVEDRYDLEYYTYLLAYKMDTHKTKNMPAKIGMLPDEWRVDGKVDFDMALAQGRTRQDIDNVILTAITPAEYKENLTDEAARIVGRKIARHFFKSPVKREHSRYIIEKKMESGQTFEQVVSNFIINIKAVIYDNMERTITRNVQFVNEFDEKSEVFDLTPADMSGLDSFKKFCFSHGNYLFKGSTADLTSIWEYEFSRDIGEVIKTPERVGRITPDFWLFANLAIKDGKIYYPDNDGVIWVDGIGYRPKALEVGSKDEPTQTNMPNMVEKPIDMVDVAEKMRQTIGGYEAYIGIGWAIATLFSDEIFKEFKMFPFLYPHGKRGAGKTSFMRWLMCIFGIETEGFSVVTSSTVHMVRLLSYYSSLGVWFDEYRNHIDIKRKADGFLRSAYNRQVTGKGIKQSFGVKSYRVSATVALSGEAMPDDNGLFTRLIPVSISAYRRDRTHYDWLMKKCANFSGFAMEVILKHSEIKPKILKYITELKGILVGRGVDDRTAENWAICAGTFESMVKEDDQFIEWVFNQCSELKVSGEEDHMLNQFWDDVNVMYSDGTINAKEIKVVGKPVTHLFFWFNNIYGAWCEFYRKKTGQNPFDKASIVNYLKDEPYFVKAEQRRLNKVVRSGYLIDVQKATDVIRELAESISSTQNEPPEYLDDPLP